MGVMVPKSPSISPLIPAEKNKVSAPPRRHHRFQNVSDHSPSMVNGELVESFRNPFEFVSKAVECGDPTAAEIAYQNGIAEFAEIASGPHHAPRRVEPVAMREVADVPALGSEDFDES